MAGANYLSKIRSDLFIVTNTYAHKNGSQIGMRPNKLSRRNVSTPVLTKKASEIVIPTRPNRNARKSFFSLLMNRSAKVNRI
jgi:hypothetical protein